MSVEGLEELFQQTWLDHVLHYGLLVGAVFQLICIAAIVVLPPRPEEEGDEEADGPGDSGGEAKDDHSPTGNKNGQLTSSTKGKKGGKGPRRRR